MREDWTFCSGRGELRGSIEPHRGASTPLAQEAPEHARVSRRSALALGSIGLLGLLGARQTALAQAAFSPDAERRDLLVVVFLRGGADGLNVVVPYGDDAYHRARPSLALASPSSSTPPSERTLDLDGFFGLHPALAPLYPHYREGRMGLIHAVGSGDQSRSHFEAMSAMERGLPNALIGTGSGWLARYLTASQGANDSPLRAVALGSMLPDSLRGGIGGSALESLADFKLHGHKGSGTKFERLLKLAYSEGKDEASQAGRDTLDVLEKLGEIERPDSPGAGYPDTELGRGLSQVAMLAKAGVGLEVACLDKGGWDTHVAQGVTSGWLPGLLDDLGRSIAAFDDDMGRRMQRTTLMVMTEFGRRVYENTGLGTDHGRASVMFLLGGGVQGGRVFGRWPGLAEDQLEEPGDLRVTTDYRQVLAEILKSRMGFEGPSSIFDDMAFEPVGVCH